MASACVNNISMSPENFPAAKYSSYGWLSPRVSISGDDAGKSQPEEKPKKKQLPELVADPELTQTGDFEFRLNDDDPVTMLPADELFSDGKLVPLHLTSVKPSVNTTETEKSCRRTEISGADPYLFSPKAPRCSSRWRELLGFRKLTTSTTKTNDPTTTTTKTSSFSSSSHNVKSLKHFLHRSSKSSSSSSSSDGSLNLPLLKETTSLSDCECVSISSSRLSLSSSSSGHEHEELPRLSLDSSDKLPNPNPFVKNPHPRLRLVRPHTGDNGSGSGSGSGSRVGRSPMRRRAEPRGVSVDSPRLNSSGKIVFESLERSSSSPSSFNGGVRYNKHSRGMERSYSANVRVTPVLNVPVCSLRGSSKSFGFGQLFSSSTNQQKKDGSSNGGGGKSTNSSGSRSRGG